MLTESRLQKEQEALETLKWQLLKLLERDVEIRDALRQALKDEKTKRVFV